MSLRSAIASLVSPPAELPQTDKRNEVATSFFSSKRFLIVIAFGVLLVLNMLPVALFHDVALVVIAYLLGETVTKSVTVFVNGWIKVREVNTDIDYERLNAEQGKLRASMLGQLGGTLGGVGSASNVPRQP